MDTRIKDIRSIDGRPPDLREEINARRAVVRKQEAMRGCLRCDVQFMSNNAGNRICHLCAVKNERLGGSCGTES